VLRGQVVAVEHAEWRGSWLAFNEHEQVGGLAAAAAARRRKAQRLPTDLAVTARARANAHLCRLVDLSQTGARLTGLTNLVRPGAEFHLSVFGRPAPGDAIGPAVVVWQHGLETGVRFLGDGAAKLAVNRLRAEASGAWTGAFEARHDVACRCLTGARPVVPPIPSAAAVVHEPARSAAPKEHTARGRGQPKTGLLALLIRSVLPAR